MVWVKQTDTEATHACPQPGGGSLGDLWRCDECGELWRLGEACDSCDRYGPQPHPGMCSVGWTWRPATFWQRVRNRKRGRRP